MKKIKRIGVLTSGGDAPGMNAAVRAVVRTALAYGIECIGIRRGWQGLINADFVQLSRESVGHILSRGGTILYTARSDDFMTEKGRKKAVATCKMLGLDAIVAIGGDGTFRGALELSRLGVPVVGVPATIDNDVGCTNYTIGFDTACNTAIECIDRLRDTMQSHERCSVVEVMGRNAGFLALYVGISVGATAVLVPEHETDFQKDVVERIQGARLAGNTHFMIVVAEGAGSAIEIGEKIEEAVGIHPGRGAQQLHHRHQGGRHRGDPHRGGPDHEEASADGSLSHHGGHAVRRHGQSLNQNTAAPDRIGRGRLLLWTMLQPEQQAEERGAQNHGRKAARPVSAPVEAVKILPRLRVHDLAQVQKAVEQHREHPDQRQKRRHRRPVPGEKGDQRQQRAEEMQKEIRAAEQGLVAELRPQKDQHRQQRHGDGVGRHILEQQERDRDGAAQTGDGQRQRDQGAEGVGQNGEIAQDLRGGIAGLRSGVLCDRLYDGAGI